MEKLKIGIVEDELIIADVITNTLHKIGYNTTEPASTFNEAIAMIESEKPDVVLLDINIKGSKDGIDIAHKINADYQIPFIFLTANADAATLERAKTTNPPAYLVKPFTKDDLYTAIEICFNNFSKNKSETNETHTAKELQDYLINDALFIKDGNYFHKIKFADIVYLEADHVYVNVITTSKRLLVRSSMQQYLSHFDPKKFIQIHRSFVINIDYIETINSENIMLKNFTLPLGRTYREKLLQNLKLG
ncbi:MAG: LytR/AlgR family response regulator transcription factor [Chitinophagaceae bacterium]